MARWFEIDGRAQTAWLAGHADAEGSLPLGRKASGRRFGIVGLGRIGAAIAARLAPFGSIAYTGTHARPVPDEYHPDAVARARACDVLVVACAANRAMVRMTGRVAVITGAGSGIGRAVAITLAERGYRLVLAGRRGAALEATRHLLAGDAALHLPVPTDVTDGASVTALFDRTVEAFGRVDLLFNNAGINFPDVPIEAMTEADWRRVIDTNLTGAFLCLREAFRAMKHQRPQGGRIINNGSISAHSPRPNSIAYTASKHAITGLTKSTSLDGRAFGIACGQIDIGNAASAMGSRMADGVPQPNGTRAAEPVMDVALVGETIAYMDSLPLEANVQFLTVMATAMPFIGRG